MICEGSGGYDFKNYTHDYKFKGYEVWVNKKDISAKELNGYLAKYVKKNKPSYAIKDKSYKDVFDQFSKFLEQRDIEPNEINLGTIIIDEPELGLHPAALDVLADIIHATAKETQVICSTQSVAFANLFAPEDFIVVDAEDGQENGHMFA